jgi:hypothetical protein
MTSNISSARKVKPMNRKPYLVARIEIDRLDQTDLRGLRRACVRRWSRHRSRRRGDAVDDVRAACGAGRHQRSAKREIADAVARLEALVGDVAL